jgi:hypothetical protein
VARVVESVAVEFDCEPVLGPATVDPVPAGRAVRDREGEPLGTHVLEKTSLELAQRDANIPVHDPA